MSQSFVNPSKIQTKIYIFSPGGENKVMTSSPPKNNCPTAEKLPKTSGVKQECQGDKGKQELHPDRSDKTSNEQTLKQNSEKELRKKEQELQGKEKEIEELKRKEKNAQHELQQQDQENKILIKELKEEIKRLNAKIKKLEEDVEKLKEENQEIKGNLFLNAMCDQLQKKFYKIVFYPHDFSEYEHQSYQERYIEDDINAEPGLYGRKTEEDKRQARKRWSDLKKNLGWDSRRHVRGIKQLKYDRNRKAHPKITKDMKESLEERANALKLDEYMFGIVQNLIKMWFKTEDLVQEQEKKKNKEQTA